MGTVATLKLSSNSASSKGCINEKFNRELTEGSYVICTTGLNFYWFGKVLHIDNDKAQIEIDVNSEKDHALLHRISITGHQSIPDYLTACRTNCIKLSESSYNLLHKTHHMDAERVYRGGVLHYKINTPTTRGSVCLMRCVTNNSSNSNQISFTDKYEYVIACGDGSYISAEGKIKKEQNLIPLYYIADPNNCLEEERDIIISLIDNLKRLYFLNLNDEKIGTLYYDENTLLYSLYLGKYKVRATVNGENVEHFYQFRLGKHVSGEHKLYFVPLFYTTYGIFNNKEYTKNSSLEDYIRKEQLTARSNVIPDAPMFGYNLRKKGRIVEQFDTAKFPKMFPREFKYEKQRFKDGKNYLLTYTFTRVD